MSPEKVRYPTQPTKVDPSLVLALLAIAAAAYLSLPLAAALAGAFLLVKWPEFLLAFTWIGMSLLVDVIPEGSGLVISTALLGLVSVQAMLRRSEGDLPVPFMLATIVTSGIGVVYLWATMTVPTQHAADRPAQFVAGAILLPATLVLLRSRAALFRYLWALVVLGVVLAVSELLRLAGGGVVHQNEVAFGLNPISLGRSTMLATLAAYWLLRRSPAKLARVLLVFAFVVTIAGTVGTGSRAPLIGTLLGAALITAAASMKARLTVLAGAVLAAGYVMSTEGVRRLTETNSGEGNVSSRLEAWRASLETFSSAPFTGAGVGRYWEGSVARVQPLDFPHNLMLEIAAELGIFPLVALLAVLVLVWHRNVVESRAFLIAALAVVLFSGNLGTSQILWAVLGLGWAAKRLLQVAETDAEDETQESPKRISAR